jgi:hypothetical protein
MGKVFSIQTGPVFSMLIKENVDVISEYFSNQSLDNSFNEINLGWQAGLGIEFWRIYINARYEFGVNNIFKEILIPGTSIMIVPDGRANLFITTIGFKFLPEPIL